MKKTLFYIIIALFLIIAGCAQVGTLTGGDKDTDPPVLLKNKPKQYSLNFKGNKLTFKFDEYFVLTDLNSVFISSPPLSEKPEFKVKGKKFIVEFNEKLKDTTTYMFWFANAIQDNNEKNPYKDFKFVFSTGNKIDTMEISGVVKDAYTHKIDPDMYVMLYKDYNDSTPIVEKPYYIAKTDTSGKFTIDYIKEGKYRIFVLKDLDVNLMFNLPNEKIAYLDSFLVPKVITETKIDTFKAGSVLHIGSEDAAGDTLVNDTVITSYNYIYSPKDVILFSFEEDNNKQYIFDSKRAMKGKCKFDFNQKQDSIIVSPLNFDLSKEDYYTEKADTGRTLIYWIKNKELYEKDTLSFSVSYFNKDSVENLIKETDTIDFSFNIEKDTIQKSVAFEELKIEQDSFANYLLEANTPISKFDTSKIKLFEIFDTLVTDTRKQELIKHLRPAPSELTFTIKRPYTDNFFIELLNSDSIKNWYTKSYSKDSTILNCKITETSIYQKDTLKVILHYDNMFFKGQVHKTSDTLSLPLIKQGVAFVKRPASDTIKIQFKKKIANSTEIAVNEMDIPNWYSRIKTEDDNVFLLRINKKEIENKDTLILIIKTKDYENTDGDKIDFEYSKKAVFKFDKQKIKKVAREERNRFYFIFNKPLHRNISITPLSFTLNNDWYKKEINVRKDTIVYTITDRFATSIDTIKVEVKYDILNQIKELEEVKDTLSFVYKRVRERRKRTARNKKSTNPKTDKTDVTTTNGEELKSVAINLPIQYKLEKDTLSERKYNIIYPWKSGINYLLKMDSTAFTDIYDDYSKEKEVKFKIRTSNSYSNLKIKLSNINDISKANFYSKLNKTAIDTTSSDTLVSDSIMLETIINDSLISSNLEKGQIILTLYNEKKEIIKTNFTSSDSTFTTNQLIPGKYSLKIVYDENNNKKWDTGKYIKNIQPERITIYSKEIDLKEGEETEVVWEL